MDTLHPRTQDSNHINILFPPIDKTYCHYVYTLAYPDGKVFYVGKGKYDRILDHEQDARREHSRERNGHKINTIRKIWANGGHVIKTKLAFFQDHEDALAYEAALIFFMPNLTNLTDGGRGPNGYIPTEEARKKLSKAGKGRPKPEGFGQKISESNRRRKLSEETRKKISDAKTGNTHHTEESRRKLSEAGKNRKWTEEQRKNSLGRVVSQETREAISRAQKGISRNLSEEQRQKRSEISKKLVHTEETRKKMSESQKGRGKGRPKPEGFGQKMAMINRGFKHSEETRQKMKESRLRKDAGKEARERIAAAVAEYPDMSNKKIAKMLGYSDTTIRNWKKIHLNS